MAELSNPVILGSEAFVTEIKERFIRGKKTDRDLPALRSLSNRQELDQIEKAVESALPTDKKLARQIKLYFCHRYSGRKLSDIGERFGIGQSGVTQASYRIGLKARKEKKLSKLIERIEKKLIL